MTPDELASVDRYFESLFVSDDPVLEAALKNSRAAGLPPHQVSKSQGKLLFLLACMQRAETILEIGTLGGVSTIWLARALPPGGRLITLEANARRAEVARSNLTLAGLSQRVELRQGNALETLPALTGPFDLVFIDADKPNNPDYFRYALTLSRPGGVIIANNVVREGAVADANSQDPSVRGIQRMNQLIAAEPRVSATAIQTVGDKGWDGFLIARVEG